MSVVALDGVSFAYGGGPAVLTDVDLVVEPGEFVGVAGPNGGGKTTLIRLVVGLERPSRGTVRAPARIGYLPQRARAAIDAPITVEELVGAGRVSVRGVLRSLRATDRAAVGAAIDRVGLTDQRHRAISKLSGGQEQRAFIAKALAGDPELLVLDEPTSGVDAGAQEALAGLLAELHDETGLTILYVSHEFGAIEPHVERLVLVRGGIEFDGPPGALPHRWHDPSHVHP